MSRLSRLSRTWDRWDRWDRFFAWFRDFDVALLCLIEPALNRAFRHIKQFRNLTNGFAVTLEFQDFNNLVVVVGDFEVLEMVLLFGIALNLEL